MEGQGGFQLQAGRQALRCVQEDSTPSTPSRGDVLGVVSSQEAVRCRSSYHHYESKTQLNLKTVLTYCNSNIQKPENVDSCFKTS